MQAMQQRMQQLEHQNQQQAAAIASAAAATSSFVSSSLPSHSSSSSVNRLDKIFKPESFSNEKGKNIDYWIADLDRYFSARGVMSDSDQVNYVQVLLKGQVGQWYDGVVRDGVQPMNNWSEIKKALLERFRPADISRIARDALDKLQQLSNVDVYNQLYMNTVERINGFAESEKVYNYVKGLKLYIKIEVDRENPTTLNSAMISAMKAESRLRLSTQSSTNRSTNNFIPRYSNSTSTPSSSTSAPMELGNMNTDETHYEEGDDSGNSHQLNVMNQKKSYAAKVPGRLSHEEIEKLKREGKCFHCKQHGHMKSTCPALAAARNSKKF